MMKSNLHIIYANPTNQRYGAIRQRYCIGELSVKNFEKITREFHRLKVYFFEQPPLPNSTSTFPHQELFLFRFNAQCFPSFYSKIATFSLISATICRLPISLLNICDSSSLNFLLKNKLNKRYVRIRRIPLLRGLKIFLTEFACDSRMILLSSLQLLIAHSGTQVVCIADYEYLKSHIIAGTF